MSRRLAGPPDPDIELPAVILELAGGSALRPVWRNQVGGITVAIGEPVDRYLKWVPLGADEAVPDLAVEAERLRWAGRFTPVPEVLDQGRDQEASWLLTAALPGASAVDPVWVADPEPAVRAIGRGLRALHDRLPVDACPFDWSPRHRLRHLQPHLEHHRDQLMQPPPVDRLVVCHGDACAPNTLVGPDGDWVAHVDLGSLGTADRWADLAVAGASLGWNFGAGWEPTFLHAYGIDPDPGRTAYYRQLWDCT